MVNEGTRAAGAGAVHALVSAAVKEDDLGILTAKLDHHVGVGLQATDGLARGKDLLHEGQTCRTGKTQTCRAGYGHLQRGVADLLL